MIRIIVSFDNLWKIKMKYTIIFFLVTLINIDLTFTKLERLGIIIIFWYTSYNLMTIHTIFHRIRNHGYSLTESEKCLSPS